MANGESRGGVDLNGLKFVWDVPVLREAGLTMAIQPCKMFSGGRHAPFSLLDLRPAQFILSGSKFFGGQIRRLKLDSILVSSSRQP